MSKPYTILDFRFCEKLRGRVPRLEQTFQDRFWIETGFTGKLLGNSFVAIILQFGIKFQDARYINAKHT
ncbi:MULTISPECIES: hypothetical protein [Nostocales]|uniref:hypothetical protein n=1 Tax=Nostocales TaxID=1161 RepID=UPI0016861C87|nr:MULTISPECIES: hypothetical protein [Nostocales]MBD2486893.1 hypothetical protein [Aulosira sp. FACHB-615]